MDSETALQIGHINGRLDGHDEALAGVRDQVGDIHGAVGRIEGRQSRIEQKLDRVLGSGPQVALVQAQPATEPKTETVVGKALALAGKPIAIHALYLGGVVIALLIFAVWQSGRPASDFLPGLRDQPRSGIGPLDHKDGHP